MQIFTNLYIKKVGKIVFYIGRGHKEFVPEDSSNLCSNYIDK